MKICIDSFAQNGLLCFGLLIVLYSILMIFLMNFNVGICASLALGIVFCLTGCFYNNLKNSIIFRVLLIVMLLLLITFACMSIYTVSYGKNNNPTHKEDAIIVLGCGIDGSNVTPQLASRLDAAINYYKLNEKIIVVSGGKGSQEEVTEAYAMEKYLLSRGIPKDKILKEELSTSTYTNLTNSKKILDSYFNSSDYTVAIVTSDYHIYRAQKTADEVGLSSTHIHSSINWYEYPIRCFRENLAMMKYWVDTMPLADE